MSTDEQPTYYRIHHDTAVETDEGTSLRALTGRQVDPYDVPEQWEQQDAARASDEEAAQWGAAYATFASSVTRAQEKLEAARAAWEQAQGIHAAALNDARDDYAPTHQAITRRVEEVEGMRADRNRAEQEAQARAAQEARDREDAALGPRTWVVYQPTRHTVNLKTAPDMMVPVIHLATCTLVGYKVEATSAVYVEWTYARRAEVETVLLNGAPRYARGRATDEGLPTKLCGRCKPADSLHAALGTVFETWREQVESVQAFLPNTAHGMAAALKLQDEWRHGSTPGYTIVSSLYQRAESLITPPERLIGWYSPDRQAVVPNPEALERLEKILPERGFAVRRVSVPAALLQGRLPHLSDTAVAVRRMTPQEIRLRTEGPGAPDPVPLED